MINLNHYIKAKSVATTYTTHKRDLNGTPKKQHFFVRLSLCEGYGDILSDQRTKQGLFEFTIKDLSRRLGMSWDEMWKESIEKDEYGYKKKIAKVDDENVKFYFGMTEILGEVGILLRNGIELPTGVEKIITRRNLLKMIEIANNDTLMREDEATTYVNGIGEIICLKWLKNSLVPIGWDTINECYKKIWRFYIETVGKSQEWMRSAHKKHNYIYGLTHCVINITNFYTRFIGNDEVWMNEITETKNILINLIDSQRLTLYKAFNDDTLAEMLLVVKLCCGGDPNCPEYFTALDALSMRFNSKKLIFNEHKRDSFKEELLANEHTNILYVLNVLR